MSAAEWASLVLPVLFVILAEIFIERPRHKQN